MEEAFEAIGTALKLIIGTAWYLIVMLPLAVIVFIVGLVLLPVDLLVLVISFGEIKFQIFSSFMHASKTSLMWYAETMG
ncbi:MAG TPA: hypothetical protein ENK59_00505 [Thioploca sp.]|nr:hypothetical protein [Thioploca sp.]